MYDNCAMICCTGRNVLLYVFDDILTVFDIKIIDTNGLFASLKLTIV